MSGHLAVIPQRVITDARVTPAALRVLLAIGSYTNSAGWCRVKQATIAQVLGVSQQAVSKQVNVLVRFGYVQVIHTGRSIKYRVLLDTPEGVELQPEVVDADCPIQPQVVSDSTPEVVSDSTPGGCSNITTVSNNVPQREGARAASEERFNKWFPVYPDRDGKRLGRSKALGYWLKLSIEEQRAAYRGAVNLGRAVAAGGRFGTPDPWRFLRDRTWEDWQEPAAVANGKVTPGDPLVAASWARARREDSERCPIHGSLEPGEDLPDCDGCRRAASADTPANGWSHLDNGLLL